MKCYCLTWQYPGMPLQISKRVPVLKSLLVLYINLDRSPDRREHMEAVLSDLGLPYERVAGIEGAKMKPDPVIIDPDDYARCHGRKVRPGEIGCYVSHIKAMERFLETRADYGLIMEDDAQPMPELRILLEQILQNQNLQKWDFLKLQSRRKEGHWLCEPITDVHSLGIYFTRSTGATAYIVNRKAAQSMIEKLLPMQVPWDHAFDRPDYLGLTFRMVYPHPVTFVGIGDSTIETSRPDKLTGLAKLPAVKWRIRSELGRFLWACKAYLAYRFQVR